MKAIANSSRACNLFPDLDQVPCPVPTAGSRTDCQSQLLPQWILPCICSRTKLMPEHDCGSSAGSVQQNVGLLPQASSTWRGPGVLAKTHMGLHRSLRHFYTIFLPIMSLSQESQLRPSIESVSTFFSMVIVIWATCSLETHANSWINRTQKTQVMIYVCKNVCFEWVPSDRGIENELQIWLEKKAITENRTRQVTIGSCWQLLKWSTV